MNARVDLVVGSKGGVGATTFCVDLARAIARRKQPVAVVDGDFAARRGVAVLLDQVRQLDAARTGANISTASVEGMTVVEMTATIGGAFTISPQEAEAVAATLGERYAAVVVDAPQPYAGALRAFVERAHNVVLLIEPTLLGVAGAHAVQLELTRFGIGAHNLVPVTILRGGRQTITRREIEDGLGLTIGFEIPASSDRRYRSVLDGLLDVLEQRANVVTALGPPMTGPVGDRRRGGEYRALDALPAARPNPREPAAPIAAADAARDELKAEIHAALAVRVEALTISRGVDEGTRMAELRSEVGTVVCELLAEHPSLGSAEEVARIREDIVAEAIGLGPLEELLRDPQVTEIMVNGRERIYVERGGKIEKTAKRFATDQQVRLIIERIVAPLGRRIDESQPMVDARLHDGSRVNAIIEPLAIDGPALTIRKFPTRRMQARDLVALGSLTESLVDFLRAAVEGRLNILVSGGTGSGKTTLLNVLSGFLPATERIVTIEDAAELSLAQDHVVRLEARSANIQGAGEISIRDLVRNALRMRPDRIIVGECRGGEALDMLQAMNTGHEGSLTTIHANAPRDALARLETLVLMAGLDLPVRAIREQIASALDLVVQITRLRDGSRKIVSISEVAGLEGDVITTQEIARFHQRGVDAEGRVTGAFEFTGVQPLCLQRFDELGVDYDVRQLATLARVTNW